MLKAGIREEYENKKDEIEKILHSVQLLYYPDSEKEQRKKEKDLVAKLQADEEANPFQSYKGSFFLEFQHFIDPKEKKEMQHGDLWIIMKNSIPTN